MTGDTATALITEETNGSELAPARELPELAHQVVGADQNSEREMNAVDDNRAAGDADFKSVEHRGEVSAQKMATKAIEFGDGQLRALAFPARIPFPGSLPVLRVAFWAVGILLAVVQAWIFRYVVSSDSISYLDMSDGVLRGSDWHRLINGVWSPLYPFLLGVFRRIFNISPGHEIPAGHLLNVVFFIFALASFEFFLVGMVRGLDRKNEDSGHNRMAVPLPKWAYLSIAYSLFLWAELGEISLTSLRADMLMSGFLYLAAAVLLGMHRRPASWTSYLALGALLGVAILSKEAMLPVGIFMLATTLFMVEKWRPALKMAASALALVLVIASLYFVPLSIQEGHFTMGETGRLNYVLHVDEASPHWYLQDPGSAAGAFLHPPEKLSSDLPAYAFAIPAAVTHPLRFDPSYWIAGVRPHFVLQRQIAAIETSLGVLKRLLRPLRVVIVAMLVLAFLCSNKKQVIAALTRSWPVWLIGVAGCLLYTAIYMEPRYVAAFLTLLCLGMLVGLPVPAQFDRKIAMLIVVGTTTALLYPALQEMYYGYRHQPRSNLDSQAAQALAGLGIKPGDQVARISPSVSDYAAERILRVQIAAEVHHDYADEFWSSPLATQQSLLNQFAALGVKAVIATSPRLSAENKSEWTRLGSTQFWVWRASGG